MLKYYVSAFVTEDRNLADVGLFDTEINFDVDVQSPSELEIQDKIFEHINNDTDYVIVEWIYDETGKN